MLFVTFRHDCGMVLFLTEPITGKTRGSLSAVIYERGSIHQDHTKAQLIVPGQLLGARDPHPILCHPNVSLHTAKLS